MSQEIGVTFHRPEYGRKLVLKLAEDAGLPLAMFPDATGKFLELLYSEGKFIGQAQDDPNRARLQEAFKDNKNLVVNIARRPEPAPTPPHPPVEGAA